MKLNYKLSIYDEMVNADSYPQASVNNRFMEVNSTEIAGLKCISFKQPLLANAVQVINLTSNFGLVNLKSILIKSNQEATISLTLNGTELVKATSNLLFLNKETITAYPNDGTYNLELNITTLFDSDVHIYVTGT